MPSWSSGSGTWTAPFAAATGNVVVVAGGGGGYRDNDGPGSNGKGGGGGSGGAQVGPIGLVSQGTYNYSVGAGGAWGTPGGAGGNSFFGNVGATGGAPGTDRPGGPGGSPGGNAGSGDGSQSAPGDGSGGASAYGGYGAGGRGNTNDKNNATSGGNGFVSIEVTSYSPPQINKFNVGDQNSSSGAPRDDVFIEWATTFASSVTISGIGSVATSDSGTYNTGLQSNAPGNSPAQRSYTLTASGPGGTVTLTRTANVRNDNTPSNSWTTSFINLDPTTVVTLTLGTLSGVDMPTLISTSGTGNFVGTGGSFSGSRYFYNGETVQLRTTTAAFNTDISGLPSDATFGKTNSKTVTVSTPGGSFNVTVTTREPRIKEDFDYSDNINKYPYEDIDLIENSPTQYLTSAQITANDIEIPMEMKVDQPDTQISINGGSWQNVRSI